MKHLSETGVHAGRRLCLAKDGESHHAVYAPLHNPKYRATLCPECLAVWANEAYDDGDIMPNYIVAIRQVDGKAKDPEYLKKIQAVIDAVVAAEELVPLEDLLAHANRRRAIDAILSNDEASTDEELISHFMSEIGLTEAQAKQQVSKRTEMLNRLF